MERIERLVNDFMFATIDTEDQGGDLVRPKRDALKAELLAEIRRVTAASELAEAQARRITELERANPAADTPQPDSRAAFEAWAPSAFGFTPVLLHDGRYHTISVQLAWEAWQQARREPQPVGAALEWRCCENEMPQSWDRVLLWTADGALVGYLDDDRDWWYTPMGSGIHPQRAIYWAALSAPAPSAGTDTTHSQSGEFCEYGMTNEPEM